MRCLALVLLAGCGGRNVWVVADQQDTEDPPDYADTDTGAPIDTGTPSNTEIDALACTDVATDEGDLALTWCQRVSPEPDQFLPADPTLRCGFFNALGSLAIADEVAPVLTYCDVDVGGGGIRVARYDPAGDTLTSTMASAGGCIAVAGSASMRPVGDGYLALWAEYDVGWSTGEGKLRAATVGQDGVPGTPVDAADLPGDAYSVAIAGPLVLATNFDQALYVAVAGSDGMPGTFAHVADGVREFSAVAVGGGAAVASCVDDTVQAWGLDAVGHVAWSRTVDGANCRSMWEPLGLAAGSDGRVALSWTDTDSRDGLIRFTGDGPAQTIVLPEPEGDDSGTMPPRLLVDGDSWYALTRRGEILRLADGGTTTLLGVHPAVRAHADDLREVRWFLRDGQLTFAVLWSQMLTVGPHVYGFNVLELSGAALPEP